MQLHARSYYNISCRLRNLILNNYDTSVSYVLCFLIVYGVHTDAESLAVFLNQ
jgi:hypothetical protein